jgi:hypothetical protein
LLQARKDEFDEEADPEAEAEAAERENAVGSFSWSGTDRDYTYDELLGEVQARKCKAQPSTSIYASTSGVAPLTAGSRGVLSPTRPL